MAFSLGEKRVTEIKRHVEDGGYFPCHKTTGRRHEAEDRYGDWFDVPMLEKLAIITKEQPCVGASIWTEHGRAPLDDE